MTMQVSGTSGFTFPDNTTQATAAKVGMTNRIINGAMMIDQRNAGASVTPTTNASYQSCDRWQCFLTQSSKFSIQQNAGAVSPPVGFSNYLGITSLSAYSVLSSDYFNFGQKIEGFNIADLAWGTANAQPITFSFWVRSSLTGTFGGSFSNGGGTRTYPFTYTISAANTWEQKTVTVAGDTSGTWLTNNGKGLEVYFGLGVGSTYSGTAGSWSGSYYISATGATSVVGTSGATFYITGVQLEKGSTATSFDYRPYGTELALCQRYLPLVTINADFNYIGQCYASTAAGFIVPFQVQPRVSPTGISTSGSITCVNSGGSLVGGTLAFRAATLDHAALGITGSSGLAAGNATALCVASGTQTIQFTGCEL